MAIFSDEQIAGMVELRRRQVWREAHELTPARRIELASDMVQGIERPRPPGHERTTDEEPEILAPPFVPRARLSVSDTNLRALLARVRALVDAFGAPSAIIGGVAIIARVRVRPTRDCDVVLRFSGRLDELLRVAREQGFSYESDAASRAMFEAGLVQLVIPASEAPATVDLIASDSPFLERVLARATEVDVGGGSAKVATVEDLLLLKLDANRPIDLDDAIAIKDAFADTLDRAYLAEQGDALQLRRALENLLGPLPRRL